MALLKRLYGKLHLSVNESKSAVASVFGRKFLGYAFWSSANGIKRKVASKALEQFKQRIRRLTRRSGGQSLQQVVDRLRPYILGWKAYFGLSQTPKVWRELCRLGARESIARKVAANSRCWWRNSRLELNRVLDIAWFDRMGLARLS